MNRFASSTSLNFTAKMYASANSFHKIRNNQMYQTASKTFFNYPKDHSIEQKQFAKTTYGKKFNHELRRKTTDGVAKPKLNLTNRNDISNLLQFRENYLNILKDSSIAEETCNASVGKKLFSDKF